MPRTQPWSQAEWEAYLNWQRVRLSEGKPVMGRGRTRALKELKICIRCKTHPKEPGVATCPACHAAHNAVNRDRTAAVARYRTTMGLCIRCGQAPAGALSKGGTFPTQFCAPCLEWNREHTRRYVAKKASPKSPAPDPSASA